MESIIPRLDPSNVEDDAVLGTTYRIPIKSKGWSFTRKTERGSEAEITSTVPENKRRRVVKAIADAEPMRALEDGRVDDDAEPEDDAKAAKAESGSSSSCSSSSSSSSDKKRKHKKDKKRSKNDKERSKKDKKDKNRREESAPERKAREALEKAREKEEAKRLTVVVKATEIYTKKMPAVLAGLKPLLSSDHFADVAQVVKKPVEDAIDRFEMLLSLAQSTIAAGAKNSNAGDLPAFRR
jgi:hypothetical protein